MAELKECPVCGAPVRMLLHDNRRSFSLEALPVGEVVRCKDCKHRGASYACPFRQLMHTEADGYHYVDKTTDDGFCSFGERKEASHGSD